MAEDVYAKPDLTRKVRFQRGEKEDDCDNIDNVRIYDNCWAEGGTLPEEDNYTTKDQQPTTSVHVSSGQINILRAVALSVVLLCLLLMVAVIVLVVLSNPDERDCNTERKRLWGDFVNLSVERGSLQRRYTEMESLNHRLIQQTSQLLKETKLLKAVNSNLTKVRDELQTQIEAICCPDYWIKFANSCYLISTDTESWRNSQRRCEERGATLVIISSFEEQTFISSLNLDTWIGLTDEETEDVWKWVNGEIATTTYWRRGQPDDYFNEDCVEISTGQPVSRNWNDLRCTYKRRFICEKVPLNQ